MPTLFENILFSPDGSYGKLEVISTWNVWDCKQNKLSGYPQVVLRNPLLTALHPKIKFCIGKVSVDEKNPVTLNPFKPKNEEAFHLDLASGSRNDGRFTFSQQPVGKYYYGAKVGDQWRRIIYGSILHTGCKRLYYKQIKFLITNDEAKPFDDTAFQRQWQTGDAHGKASTSYMSQLGAAANPNNPIQFRAALWKEWCAKGTIAWSQQVEDSKYDLVLPQSCFKGNKPDCGEYEGKVLIGMVFQAEERRAKPGWMLFQWFSFRDLERDRIISKMKDKCRGLAAAFNDIKALADILRVDQEEAEAEMIRGEDQLESTAEYENTMMRIIKADKAGILLLHPYIVTRVYERLQAVWLNLAKAAGVRFRSLMCMPDESFRPGFEEGKLEFCAPDLPEGEYILFINPMRHWGDVQLWTNVHKGLFWNNMPNGFGLGVTQSSTGVIATSQAQLLSLGRDTDGDFVQLISSSVYPNLRGAIANFKSDPVYSHPPAVTKFPKVARQGTLQQIALGSMTDKTGIVASLLGRAQAAEVVGVYLDIPPDPPGGIQTETKNMRIIDFLSQQVQIAVDSIKSAYPNNDAGLDVVRKFLDTVEAGKIPWLAGFKDPNVYLKYACPVDDGATDTVSKLVQTVNSFWVPADLKSDISPQGYKEILFGQTNVPFSPAQEVIATQHRNEYRQQMADAIAYKNQKIAEGEYDLATQRIREVVQNAKQKKEKILATPDLNGVLYSVESWASAYWSVCHMAETGTAGLVFTLFPDEIVEKLEGVDPKNFKVLLAYAVHRGHAYWSAPEANPWNGETVTVQPYILELDGKKFLSLRMKWDGDPNRIGQFLHLGIIGTKYQAYAVLGQTKQMRIYSTRFVQGTTSEVNLFDLSMSQEEIDNWLNFR